MLPEKSPLSSGRGGTGLAGSQLCAFWDLASLCLSTTQGPQCGVEMTRRLRITCLCTGIRGQTHYFSSGELLTWKTACWRCVQWPHHWPLILGHLQTERPQNVCSRGACSESRLCATTCVLWREAIRHMFSLPGEDQGYTQRLQCPGVPGSAGHTGANQLVGSRIWPHPEFYL